MAEETDKLTTFDRIDPAAATLDEPQASVLETSPESWASADEGTDDADEGGIEEETAQIKAQIAETRQQMGETIDAIQEKLSFSNISEQVSEQLSSAIETAKHTVYDATIGKAVTYMKEMGNEISGSTAVKMVRNNPLPFILIAAGAGLLAYNSFGSKRSGGSGSANRLASRARRELEDDLGIEQSGGQRSLLGTAKEKVSGVAESVTGAAGSAYDSVTNAASSTYAGIANSANNAYVGANELAHRTYDKLGEYGSAAQEQYNYYLEETPMAVGAVALALGAAVGFAIPSTRYEGELMGEARENLMQKAQDSAGQLVERVKEVASEAGEAVKSEIKDKGIIH